MFACAAAKSGGICIFVSLVGLAEGVAMPGELSTIGALLIGGLFWAFEVGITVPVGDEHEVIKQKTIIKFINRNNAFIWSPYNF